MYHSISWLRWVLAPIVSQLVLIVIQLVLIVIQLVLIVMQWVLISIALVLFLSQLCVKLVKISLNYITTKQSFAYLSLIVQSKHIQCHSIKIILCYCVNLKHSLMGIPAHKILQ